MGPEGYYEATKDSDIGQIENRPHAQIYEIDNASPHQYIQ
jgi:hypothetical protein